MASITSYLTFNGNCREAMTFYQQCLGGELRFQTIGDSPLGDVLPADMQQFILHATLRHNQLVLMASDVQDETLVRGNGVSMLLCCRKLQEAQGYFKQLSRHASAVEPLIKSSNNTWCGSLMDQYGNQWLLVVNESTGSNNRDNDYGSY